MIYEKVHYQRQKKLSGNATISGSKNAALPILSATLLTEEEVIIKNVPVLSDIKTMISLLEKLGKAIIWDKNQLIIREVKQGNYQATYDIVRQMRASIVVLGPLLARYKQAIVSLPGGCAFGPRPIDLHLKAMKELSANISLKGGNVHAKVKSKLDRLKGNKINIIGEFGSSVLATDNAIMAATLAKGTTTLTGCAKEPETIDLVHFLKKMGAKITGEGTSTITVTGVDKLNGCEYTVIQDRIEAGSFIVFAAMTASKIKLHYKYSKHLESVLELCKQIGIKIKATPSYLLVKGELPHKYKAFNVTTMPYPHFPTDLQPLFLALASIVPEISKVKEKIYTTRFRHGEELMRMGADVHLENDTAMIKGVKELQGAIVEGFDLRGGAALIAAGLSAKNTTEVLGVKYIERGYESIVNKLKKIGADIKEENTL